MNKKEFYNTIPKIEIKELSEKIKLPAFVYFRKIIRNIYKELNSCLPDNFEVHYAFKANPNKEILKFVNSLGAGADVGSIGELLLAEETGYPPEKIEFTGPGKTADELEKAIDLAIYAINIESLSEIKKISEICRKKNKKAGIGIRLNPKIKSRGSAIKMSKDTQFGIIEDDIDEALALIKKNEAHFHFRGFHIHTGSQMLEAKGIIENFGFILEKIYEIAKKRDLKLQKINFGGGWGVDMYGNKPAIELPKVKEGLFDLFSMPKYSLLFKDTKFIIEPGRLIVSECGIYITKIIYKKKGYNKHFLIVDGGMHHHYAAAGGIGQVIRRNYAVDDLLGSDTKEKFTVTGSLCSPSDILANDIVLSRNIDEGDSLIFFNSGGYALSASPVDFLGHPLPEEILI